MEWERERNRIKESLTEDQRNEGDTEGVCRHLRIPLQWEPVWAHRSVWDTIHLLATLPTPPIGGAHVLTGICVTNLSLSLPRLHTLPLFITWLFLYLSLSFLPLSQLDVWTKETVGWVRGIVGLLPLATWIPTQWWPGEGFLSTGINAGIEKLKKKEREKRVVLMTNTSEELEPQALVFSRNITLHCS